MSLKVTRKGDRYYIVSSGKNPRRMTVADMMTVDPGALADVIFTYLAKISKRRRFYWEWRKINPVTAGTDVFWFRLVTTQYLSDVTDFRRFHDKIQTLCNRRDTYPPVRKHRTMVFTSPHGTRLVCPCPRYIPASVSRSCQAYGNISLFAMNASYTDKKALMSRLLREIRHRKAPFRVRTHGHDVPWLHIRIENTV